MHTKTKPPVAPGAPASIYLDQDESGEPRIIEHTVRATDPMARHVRRLVEKL